MTEEADSVRAVQSKMAKIKIEEIRKAAIDHNWTLISTEYINLDTELIFECDEGHRVHLPYRKVRDKWECPVCKQNKLKNNINNIIPKPKGVSRVLALDQATHLTGYAVFDNDQLVTSGIFQTELTDSIVRANAVKNWLISMVESWKPDVIGFEDIQLQQFNGKNIGVTTYKILAELLGILIETCFENSWPYVVCAPATWRAYSGVKGRTRADKKKSMQKLIKEWFDITVTDDESDGIGIGKYIAEKRVRQTQVFDWE